MALPNLTGQKIQDTYQRLVQVSASGDLTDGTGSLFLPPSSSYALTASYAHSASVEITKEISSSYAETASFALSGDGTFSGSFSGSYVGDGSNLTGVSAFPFTGDATITGSLTVSGSFVPHGKGPTSNTVMGLSAGASLTAASTENIMIGKEAGEAQASGDANIMIGVKAGEVSTNDSNCILIGRKAGGASTLGNNNIFIGYEAGRDCSSTHGSIGIGAYALFESNDGGGSGYNAAFGWKSGYSITSGDYNLFLGYEAGYDITTGANNIIIGSGSKGEAGITDQLRIGSGNSLTTISASLATGDITFPAAVNVGGTQRSLFTSCSLAYSGSNIINVTQSFDSGNTQITNITYSGSFADGNPLKIEVTGSDGLVKAYTLTYSASLVTEILVT